MRTFKLINPVKSEILPTKSFVRTVPGGVLVAMDKDYGDEIKIHGEKSDAILYKINIESNIILNGSRRVTVSCGFTTNIHTTATLLFPIRDDATYFSNATVYGIDYQILSDVIGDGDLSLLESGALKLTEIPSKQHTDGKAPNFIIVSKLVHKAPLIKEQMYFNTPDKVVMVTDKDYGENIIISKDDYKKVSLTRMDTLSCTVIGKAKKLSVLYTLDNILWDGVKCAESFYVPSDYSEPTAYIVSLKEFISTIGRNYFRQLGYNTLGFSLSDPKCVKTYSMNFEAINRVASEDVINIFYKIEKDPMTFCAGGHIIHKIEPADTRFNNIDFLRDAMKSFIKETKEKYNISYSEWNCKVYIKSYSYYDGECVIEEEHDLTSEAFLEVLHF